MISLGDAAAESEEHESIATSTLSAQPSSEKSSIQIEARKQLSAQQQWDWEGELQQRGRLSNLAEHERPQLFDGQQRNRQQRKREADALGMALRPETIREQRLQLCNTPREC